MKNYEKKYKSDSSMQIWSTVNQSINQSFVEYIGKCCFFYNLIYCEEDNHIFLFLSQFSNYFARKLYFFSIFARKDGNMQVNITKFNKNNILPQLLDTHSRISMQFVNENKNKWHTVTKLSISNSNILSHSIKNRVKFLSVWSSFKCN